MKSTIYQIHGPWQGRLAIVPRPRGGDWLEDETRAWRDAGFDTVVSLLTPEEQRELDLRGEPTHCRAQSIEFRTFPIADRSVPQSRESFLREVEALHARLLAGKNVAIHCRQGIGRSAMLAAALLIASGIPPDDAFHRIETARGRPVPDTREQREWIGDLALVGHSARTDFKPTH